MNKAFIVGLFGLLSVSAVKADMLFPALVGAGVYIAHENQIFEKYAQYPEVDNNTKINKFDDTFDHYDVGTQMIDEKWITKNGRFFGELHLEEAANRGNLDAAFVLSGRLLDRQDYIKGQQLLIKSANSGYAPAIKTLAKHYEQGTGGFEKNYISAFAYWYELTKHKDPEAFHTIAYYFFHGLHDVKSEEAAAHWYHRSAKEFNYKDSRIAYAWLAENGLGTEKNAEEAAWYK